MKNIMKNLVKTSLEFIITTTAIVGIASLANGCVDRTAQISKFYKTPIYQRLCQERGHHSISFTEDGIIRRIEMEVDSNRCTEEGDGVELDAYVREYGLSLKRPELMWFSDEMCDGTPESIHTYNYNTDGSVYGNYWVRDHFSPYPSGGWGGISSMVTERDGKSIRLIWHYEEDNNPNLNVHVAKTDLDTGCIAKWMRDKDGDGVPEEIERNVFCK